MEYRRFGDTLVVRLDPGEEITEQMRTLAQRENLLLQTSRGWGR